MKKILFVMLICGLGFTAKSQVMQAKAQWVTITSANLKCWTCKEVLDKYLVRVNKAGMDGGMAQWKFNVQKGEIKVQYYPDRVSVDDIKLAINEAGFDADAEKAEVEAYKKLPSQCKRAEEGGGPKKGDQPPCHLPPQ